MMQIPVSKAEAEKPHRIFPRSDQSPTQVIPVKQTSENGTTAQLPIWQRYENGSLDRTTIQPNLHYVVRDGEIERNEIALSSTARSKSIPHANPLPIKRNEIISEEHDVAVESFEQKLPMKSSASHQKVFYS